MHPMVPSDTSAALAILTLLADPASAKQQLEEMRAEKEQTIKAATEAAEAKAQAAAAQMAAKAALDENHRVLAKIERENGKAASDLAQGLKNLEAGRTKLADEQKQFERVSTARASELGDREVKVLQRERDLQGVASTLERRTAEIDRLKSELETKLGRLKEAVS